MKHLLSFAPRFVVRDEVILPGSQRVLPVEYGFFPPECPRLRASVGACILLRFLTGEPPGMFAAAAAFIERAERGEVVLELSPLVLAETAFTLESFYQRPRREVARTLLTLVHRLGVRLAEKELLLAALEQVQNTGIHLVDAYLAASAAETKLPVASFDRDFDKFPNVQRFDPRP